jgi:hypothetical protein
MSGGESRADLFEMHEHGFTNEQLEGVYSQGKPPALLFVQPWLAEEARRALELEACGYRTGAPLPCGGAMFFMYVAAPPDEAQPLRVAAIASVIGRMEPGWVAAVAEVRRYADCPRVMAAWCEIPVLAATAALDVLRSREAAS